MLNRAYGRRAPKDIPECDTPLAAFQRNHPHLSYYRIGKTASVRDGRIRYIAKGQIKPTLIEALKLEHHWQIPVSSWASTEWGQREWGRHDEDHARRRQQNRERWRRWAAKPSSKTKLRAKGRAWRLKRKNAKTKEA